MDESVQVRPPKRDAKDRVIMLLELAFAVILCSGLLAYILGFYAAWLYVCASKGWDLLMGMVGMS